MDTKVKTLIAGIPYHARYMIAFLMFCLIVGIGIDILHAALAHPFLSTTTRSSTHSVGEVSPLSYQSPNAITPIADSYSGGTISPISTSSVSKLATAPVPITKTVNRAVSTKPLVETAVSPQPTGASTTVEAAPVLDIDPSITLSASTTDEDVSSADSSSLQTPISPTTTTPLAPVSACLATLVASVCLN
jgi:hypothetical protein